MDTSLYAGNEKNLKDPLYTNSVEGEHIESVLLSQELYYCNLDSDS
jgi:hypothetical protein